MKKLLIAISVVFLLCSATAYWANLTVNGDIIKTDPTYSGTLTIHHTANNQITFNNSFIGDFMVAGPLNTITFGVNQLTSNVRGAAFGSTTSGVPALATNAGNVDLNQNTGTRTIIGANITDDGVHQLQTTSILATAFKMGATTAGYVLTADANGNYTPQAPTGGSGTSGTYIPTLTGSTGVTALTLQNATYIKEGNIVHVSITATYNCSTTGLTYIYFTLPFTTSTPAQNAGFAGIQQSAQAGITGVVEINSTTGGYSDFYTSIAVSSGIEMQFDYHTN
jgi:hypothetical protein